MEEIDSNADVNWQYEYKRLYQEVNTFQAELNNIKAVNEKIVEVITAMYDQVHEERDALRRKLDDAVEALRRCRMHPLAIGYVVDEALKKLEE